MTPEQDTITLRIEGMTCAHCAMTVSKVLEKNGAEQPSVNYATGEASFRLPLKNRYEQIVSAISKAGYKVIGEIAADSKAEGDSGLSRVEKRFLFTLPFTIVLFFSHMLFPHDFVLNKPLVQLLLCLPVAVVGWIHFGKSAWNSIRVGAPNMDVLILVGSGAAFGYSLAGMALFYGTHQVQNYLFFETAATIISLILLGNAIEHRSVKRTTSAIGELSRLQAVTAKKVVLRDGQEIIQDVPVKEISVGDVLLVNSGDKVPADGSVLSGSVSIDESMITGESLPVEKENGAKVIGGSLAVQGNMKMLVEKTGKESALARIVEMVKNAQLAKPDVQKLGDQISAVFVPVVLAIAFGTFFISHFALSVPLQNALMNSIAVLVISCPCAMGLATPTAVMVGIGRAAKNGILIKGGSSLEEFAKIRNIVFDKTGTLTTGRFRIHAIRPHNGATKEEIESILFTLEQRSSHPIATSVTKELKAKGVRAVEGIGEIKEIKGIGMEARTPGGTVYKVGSAKITAGTTEPGYSLYVIKDNTVLGMVSLEDEIKAGAKEVISFFKTTGISPVLLSGDRKSRCEEIAGPLGIERIYSEQLPDQKLNVIAALTGKGHTAMVGDGINDAPALAKASVGVSIGNATQAAIHSSQVVLLNEKDLLQLQTAYLISRHTLKTIRQNLFWAFFYNVAAIPAAAAGLLSPAIGVLAMAMSDVIVIGNSIRLRTKKLV